jgi:hypothetical protein
VWLLFVPWPFLLLGAFVAYVEWREDRDFWRAHNARWVSERDARLRRATEARWAGVEAEDERRRRLLEDY